MNLKVEKRFKEQWTKRTAKYPAPPTPMAIYAIQNSDLARKYDQYKEQTLAIHLRNQMKNGTFTGHQ